ncbi:MAG: hypothetical protein IPI91_19910 [Flavobacteriales bacterium]|nr:hypothetical protein [Flavobacteriales bacterium]
MDHYAIAYMGNDIPDLRVVRLCFLSYLRMMQQKKLKRSIAYISKNKGGHGCVCDVLEQAMKIKANG